MAYSKKASRRRYRSSKRRRYSRRRRYRRKYYRRRAGRFPKNTEVKSVVKQLENQVLVRNTNVNNDAYAYCHFPPGQVMIIGAPHVANAQNIRYTMSVSPGWLQYERIGAKIEPVKLRLTGACSMSCSVNDPLTSMNERQPCAWQIRLIVYQVRGGNGTFFPDDNQYHPLAMNTIDNYGQLEPEQLKKLLSYYNGSNIDQRYFTRDSFRWNLGMSKVPLRRGIGGQMRVLYQKSFWLSSMKPVKQFRIVTKRPKPLVYTELPDGAGDNETNATARNCIYCVWMWQPTNYIGQNNVALNVDCNYELFYTDK